MGLVLVDFKSRNMTNPYLKQCTKIYPKCISDLNLRPETVKVLEEYLGGKCLNSGLCNECLDLTQKQRQQKQK